MTENKSKETSYPELSRAEIPEDIEIGMIWAQTTDRVIGDGTDMPWYLPEDLKHFKDSTVGHAVVMGRTSWEALGDFQPLPGRENFVVTRREEYDAPGGHVHSSLPEAIRAAAEWAREHPTGSGRPTVWILGGGQVYAQCMPIADRIVVTEIKMHAPDRFQVFAPAAPPEEFDLDATAWRTSAKGHTVDGRGDLEFRICNWTRR